MSRLFSRFGIMFLNCLLLIDDGQNISYDNVALHKQSTQSTTNRDWEAQKAVDNNSRSCSSTNGSANDWWEVDLGQHHHIQDITIITYNYTPGVYSTSISVDGFMCGYIIEDKSVTVHVRCNHTIYGRKVRATNEHKNKFLMMCEFIVSGCNGRYGDHCNYTCGQCDGNENCSYENGHCRNCVPGKKYPACTKDCEDGSYGQNCSEKCGHCKDPNTCNKSTGQCSSCQEGYVMPLCKQVIKTDMVISTAVERTTKTALSTTTERTTKTALSTTTERTTKAVLSTTTERTTKTALSSTTERTTKTALSTTTERTTKTALSTTTERTTKTALSTTTERETTKATIDVNAVDTNLGLIGGVASVIVIIIIIIVIIIIIMIRKRKRTCEKMSSSDAIDSGVNSSKPDSGHKPQVGGDSVEMLHMVDCVIYEGTDVRVK